MKKYSRVFTETKRSLLEEAIKRSDDKKSVSKVSMQLCEILEERYGKGLESQAARLGLSTTGEIKNTVDEYLRRKKLKEGAIKHGSYQEVQ